MMAADIDSRFGAQVSLLNRAAHIYFTKVLAPYRLGPGRQAYLLVVTPGEAVSQEEIVRRLTVDKANVTRSVESLCAAGLMSRRRSDHDRRVWMVELTAAGIKTRTAVEESMRRWVESLRRRVRPDQWSVFADVLQTVARDAMEFAVATPVPPGATGDSTSRP